MRTFALLVLTALLLPAVGSTATLTGSVIDSYDSVDLPAVGTLDWARWPGYVTKGGRISDVAASGTFKKFGNDLREINGDRRGVKVAGGNASLRLTASAATADRTLICYLSGWNSTGRVTATLPGAPTYSVTFYDSGKYEKVVTLRYRAASKADLTLRYEALDKAGSVNIQACALQGSDGVPTPAAATNRSATLTWAAPVKNADGSPLKDLIGYKVYWGTKQGHYTNSFRIDNLLATSYTVSGLTSGTWHFVVTAINVAEQESRYSNVASKTFR